MAPDNKDRLISAALYVVFLLSFGGCQEPESVSMYSYEMSLVPEYERRQFQQVMDLINKKNIELEDLRYLQTTLLNNTLPNAFVTECVEILASLHRVEIDSFLLANLALFNYSARSMRNDDFVNYPVLNVLSRHADYSLFYATYVARTGVLDNCNLKDKDLVPYYHLLTRAFSKSSLTCVLSEEANNSRYLPCKSINLEIVMHMAN